jgi:hypothetical protein
MTEDGPRLQYSVPIGEYGWPRAAASCTFAWVPKWGKKHIGIEMKELRIFLVALMLKALDKP